MPHRILVHEQIFYVAASGVASGFCWIAAILFSAAAQWFFVTLAVSIMCSTFLSLRFRQPTESVANAVGRCGLSVMLSVFGSRGAMHYWKLDAFRDDLILLGLLAMGVCIVSYFIVISFLVALDKSSGPIGVMTLEGLLRKLGLERTNKGDKEP